MLPNTPRLFNFGLGETIDSFPKNRFSELIESVSRELIEDHREDDFRKRLADLERYAVAGQQ